MLDNGRSVNLSVKRLTVSFVGRPLGGRASIRARIRAGGDLSLQDGHGLAGFIEAEGSFGIRTTNAGRSWVCDFRLSQRDDDAAVLAQIQRRTGLGVLTPYPARGNSKPQTTWSIRSQLECLRLVGILEEFALRGRKRREFVVWAEAVRQWTAKNGAVRAVAMRHASERLRSLRCYVHPPPSTPPAQD